MKNLFVYWILYGFVELLIYIWLFKVMGFWPIMLIQIASTALGVYMFKKVGRNIFRNIRDGRTVAPYLLDTICFFISALLLTIPGVLTTLIGLLLFVPFIRNLLKPRLTKWLANKTHKTDYYFDM
ncbi:FxsA family protein [Listeria fleischmannii]|uniref:FxsA family protein n=1 Tax=Listeria fleischmannii TaxID=1069827 RepID=A0A841YB89_9LIST|nr:FxsA family protein [Listeria fleischmannii]MBC1397531.1 FxsA family protein [Listeria fleischmannii]